MTTPLLGGSVGLVIGPSAEAALGGPIAL